MVVVITKIIALPEKCMEVKQTLQALIKLVRNENGCLEYDIFENIETENCFCLVECWATQKGWRDHRQSDQFAVLLGTRNLLCEAPKLMSHEVSSFESMTAVDKNRF
jgi:quinol monooxygenase YgiN